MKYLLSFLLFVGLAFGQGSFGTGGLQPPGGGGGGAPSGPAGGSLSGTYPNPGIATSVNLPGSPTTTTQMVGDNSTKIATDAFVLANGGASPCGALGRVQLYATSTTFGCTANNSYSITGVADPSAPTVTQSGTPGMTSYGYVVLVNTLVGHTAVSATTTTITGNATLNGTNWNNIVTPNPTGCVSTEVYRVTSGGTPSSTGRIGGVQTCGSTFQDKGIAAALDTIFPNFNNTVGSYVNPSVTIGPNIWFTTAGAVGTSPPNAGSFFIGSVDLFNHIAGNTNGLGHPMWLTNLPTDAGTGTQAYIFSYVDTGTRYGFGAWGFSLVASDTPGAGDHPVDIFQAGGEGNLASDGLTVSNQDYYIYDEFNGNYLMQFRPTLSVEQSTNGKCWTSSGDASGMADSCIWRTGPNSFSLGNATPGDFTGVLKLGNEIIGGNVVNPFVMAKNTQAATAPTAGNCDLRWIAGTNIGTGKLVAACGTSATEVVIVDNVGAGF